LHRAPIFFFVRSRTTGDSWQGLLDILAGQSVVAPHGDVTRPAPNGASSPRLRGATVRLLGAAIGPGTLLVIFLLGPAVDLLSERGRVFDISAAGRL
jgi:hypothetical protein